MTEEQQKDHKSFREIVRATSIIGGASAFNIVASVVKTKIAAVLLGPAGIGTIGLLQNLLATASAMAGLGINTVGARQIAQAAAEEDEQALRHAAQALFWGTVVLALLGGIIFWLLRAPFSQLLTGSRRASDLIGWLSIGLLATVAAGSQAALLTGLQRLRAIALISIMTAVASTGIASLALLLLPFDYAVAAYLLSAPVVTVLIGQFFVTRVLTARPERMPLAILKHHWLEMARIGFWFTAAGLGGAALMLAARAHINQSLGAVALGHFQASWAIASLYLSVVLQAMGTDYLPRLSAASKDPDQVNRMVNEQAEVLLLLASPAIFAVLGGAPLIVRLLYSSEFSDSAWVLRWQVLGDIFKLMAWPLSFVLVAKGEGKTFFITDLLAPIFLLTFLWAAIPLIGLAAAGIAFIVMYGLQLPILLFVIRHRTGFVWRPSVIAISAAVFIVSGLILAATRISEMAALILSGIAVIASSACVLARLAGSNGIATGPLASLARRFNARRT